jgi:hypothetical protein
MKHETFETKDFYLSSCILATGIPLIELRPIGASVFQFVFAISPTDANILIKQHWSRELVLPTKNLIDAINELKTRLHQGY